MWWIDPRCSWFGGWCWRFVDEARRVFAECTIECVLTSGVDGVGLTVMHLVRGHQADPDVMMVPVVPVEEASAKALGVLDAAKALGEGRLILQSLEVAFGERIVVGGMRPVVRTGYAEACPWA